MTIAASLTALPPLELRSPLIAALDTADLTQAEQWAAVLGPQCGLLKLGLEFFCAHGPAGVALIRHEVFLDLKLHDIPTTVARAVRALAPIHPDMLTLHASGGAAMIAAARNAAEQAPGTRTRLLAVTVLTSLDADALAATGIAAAARQQTLLLAHLALDAGADGLVCSGQDVAMLRDAFGAGPLIVVPGIRPAGTGADDQARTVTPRQAMSDGASYIVVGRPITHAAEPARAAAAILAELA